MSHGSSAIMMSQQTRPAALRSAKRGRSLPPPPPGGGGGGNQPPRRGDGRGNQLTGYSLGSSQSPTHVASISRLPRRTFCLHESMCAPTTELSKAASSKESFDSSACNAAAQTHQPWVSAPVFAANKHVFMYVYIYAQFIYKRFVHALERTRCLGSFIATVCRTA